jgi:hypothetical protein
MSIDNCQGCDKRLDTDFVEYQDDGTLLCDGCLDELENEQHEVIEAAFDAVYDKVYVKTNGPVPEYLTAGKVYEARVDEWGYVEIADDKGKPTYSRLWTLCDQYGNPIAETDWKALAGELAWALKRIAYTQQDICAPPLMSEAEAMRRQATAALAKYDQEKGV